MSEDRHALEAAVRELEQVASRIAEAPDDADAAQALADQALTLSTRIGELLPRVIREIEDAAQGRTSEPA